MVPALWKLDVDSAFRRVPLEAAHRWASTIAFMYKGEVSGGPRHGCGCDGRVVRVLVGTCIRSQSMSLRCDSERTRMGKRCAPLRVRVATCVVVALCVAVGALITSIARRLLMLPVFRYVDDFFSMDRLECVEHGMQTMSRLVKALLGAGAVASNKVECGAQLKILGIQVVPNMEGFSCMLSREKAEKCISTMLRALQAKVLNIGCAQKLAGRLSWASLFIFIRLGRAMLRPLFDHIHSGCSRVADALTTAMEWWVDVLRRDICEVHPWVPPQTPAVHLYADARSSPPRVAAVLLADGVSYYTDAEPSVELLARFKERADKQITSLEMLAIAVGLSSFADLLHGRKVLLYSDNKGAEGATRKGSAKSWDHCSLIHQIWTLALVNHTHLWVGRVPSKANISDLPSREEYRLLQEMGALWREPVLAQLFMG